MTAGSASSTLATWRGRRVLILLCAVAFLDFVDASITNVARRNGMRNLREDGWLKVMNGVTTADEVMRVTQEF